jgi:hypothetical protein
MYRRRMEAQLVELPVTDSVPHLLPEQLGVTVEPRGDEVLRHVTVAAMGVEALIGSGA